MDEQILEGLKNQFKKHRIVFWYDDAKDMRETFESLRLDSVEKVEIFNNEFSLKYKLLKENAKQKILVYKNGPEPDEFIDNWLLDIQLSSGRFYADKKQIWLDQLNLDTSFSTIVNNHERFFKSNKRIDKLKELLPEQLDLPTIKKSMLKVITDTEANIEILLSKLLDESINEEPKYYKLIEYCNLEEFLWSIIKEKYGYTNEEPSLQDFALELFKKDYSLLDNSNQSLKTSSKFLFETWRHNTKDRQLVEKISDQFQDILEIKSDLPKRDIKTLINIDSFQEIDKYVINFLTSQLIDRTINQIDAFKLISVRKGKYWYGRFQNIYDALEAATQLLDILDNSVIGVTDLNIAIEQYTNNWYRIDHNYRKFINCFKKQGQISVLQDLSKLIENKYVNEFLLPLNDSWQNQLTALDSWGDTSISLQRNFFSENVVKLREKDTKCVVIISDALRFEIGKELKDAIESLDRFEAKLEPLLSEIPSYTQLGMAALLPQGELTISNTTTANVELSGAPTAGLENRKNILTKFNGRNSVEVLKVEDFLNKNSEESRDITRDNDILFLYQNHIDAIGDSSKTEGSVFEAVDKTIDEIVTVLRKLMSANASNVFITSDHGFIYQNEKLSESDFLSESPSGSVQFSGRRFVLGRNLTETSGFKKFSSEQLKLGNDFDILFPKSINRLRKSGAGTRYIHGGLTLQEVITPLIHVTKKRESDVSSVPVTILKGTTNTISTYQITIKFYQEVEISSKLKSRKLRVRLCSEDNVSLSSFQDIVFDSISPEARDREQTISLNLSPDTDKYNNKDVYLKLEEQQKGTSHFKVYKTEKYNVRLTFRNDFDI